MLIVELGLRSRMRLSKMYLLFTSTHLAEIGLKPATATKLLPIPNSSGCRSEIRANWNFRDDSDCNPKKRAAVMLKHVVSLVHLNISIPIPPNQYLVAFLYTRISIINYGHANALKKAPMHLQ